MKPRRGKKQWKQHKKPHKNERYSQNREPWQPREYRHCEQLTEKDVGITEYLNPSEGFSGIIKARYSDFQLNEIDLDGKIAKLTDTNMPKDFSLKMIKYNYNEVVESPDKDVPQQVWESIKNIVDGTAKEAVTLDVEHLDKDERKRIHECIKSHFGRKVIASTVPVDGKKFMKFEKFNKEIADLRQQWPDDKGEYVYFIVYKEKMDTLETMFKICSATGMKACHFQHAGNKDKRSITSQWFSAKKVDPWKLISKTKSLPNVRVGNFTFKDSPLKLGHLKGNRFRVALRNVTAEDSVIIEGLNHLKEHHFINYYGMQRFGNDKEVPTHQVGISLLQGKWKEAVELILKPKSSDDPNSQLGDVVKAKKIYSETKDAAKAYEALQRNRSKSLEGKLLEGLKNTRGNDYVTALEKVPRQMRLLYIHAFQSLIWNKMVSKRLQLFGRKPVVGDLVLINGAEDAIEEEVEEDIQSNEEENTSRSEANTGFKCRKQVKRLCEEDLSEYSIYDVVLPLPGYDVVYPEHMKPSYKESIEECGLELEMPKQKVRTYTLSGDYRKILGKVEDLSWKIVRYNNPTDNLILSDLQELRGESQLQIDENGQYKAVILEFNLSPCSYATMVLRDMMKIDTSSNVQSRLNTYHQKTPAKLDNLGAPSRVAEEEEEEADQSSLLTDPKKYELFKNSVFDAVGEKRPSSLDQGPSKKQKR